MPAAGLQEAAQRDQVAQPGLRRQVRGGQVRQATFQHATADHRLGGGGGDGAFEVAAETGQGEGVPDRADGLAGSRPEPGPPFDRSAQPGLGDGLDASAQPEPGRVGPSPARFEPLAGGVHGLAGRCLGGRFLQLRQRGRKDLGRTLERPDLDAAARRALRSSGAVFAGPGPLLPRRRPGRRCSRRLSSAAVRPGRRGQLSAIREPAVAAGCAAPACLPPVTAAAPGTRSTRTGCWSAGALTVG
jgi:hypothetical protein